MEKFSFSYILIIFKYANDACSHRVGDKILVQSAQSLKNIVGTRSICAGWRGEEVKFYIPIILAAEAYNIGLKYSKYSSQSNKAKGNNF